MTKPKKQDKCLHRIKEVLKAENKTAYWLAQETGIAYNSIHNYVTNKVEPSLTNLKRIKDKLGVPGKDLINF